MDLLAMANERSGDPGATTKPAWWCWPANLKPTSARTVPRESVQRKDTSTTGSEDRKTEVVGRDNMPRTQPLPEGVFKLRPPGFWFVAQTDHSLG
jgi:hypothetical protein